MLGPSAYLGNTGKMRDEFSAGDFHVSICAELILRIDVFFEDVKFAVAE